MSGQLRLRVRVIVSTLIALGATAAVGAGTVLAGGGPPPFPH